MSLRPSLTPSPCLHHQPVWALQRGPLQPAFTTNELPSTARLCPPSLLGLPTPMTHLQVVPIKVDTHKTSPAAPHNTKKAITAAATTRRRSRWQRRREHDQDGGGDSTRIAVANRCGGNDGKTTKTAAATRRRQQQRQRRCKDNQDGGSDGAKTIKTAGATVRRRSRRPRWRR
ncbi:hypothetical protein EDB83DRAFT_2323374 [Lactarius deliciosus]|nr:hypothetical protein EDB83DRAFT_2323374 [Lactarius deliciosus]